ncbi:MAG: hypothetical protein H6712_23325 [Myxococcales bacterium]|nr:hypothetical protein [Myxococcales bacterium]MCB9716809.1 hypothetical protein [Myxococcales bacterium]
MSLLALAGAGPLTTLGLLAGAVALLALWARTRRLESSGVRRQTVSLGGQHALHVIELEGRRLVVGTGPGAAPRLLTELEARRDGGEPMPEGALGGQGLGDDSGARAR